jgi:hypothetical protein
MIILALVLIPFVAGSIIVWQSVKNAPEGFQDQSGFHLGKQTNASVRCPDADHLSKHAREEFPLSA